MIVSLSSFSSTGGNIVCHLYTSGSFLSRRWVGLCLSDGTTFFLDSWSPFKNMKSMWGTRTGPYVTNPPWPLGLQYGCGDSRPGRGLLLGRGWGSGCNERPYLGPSQTERKVHQICASIRIPGAKAQLTFAGRGHFMGKRKKGCLSDLLCEIRLFWGQGGCCPKFWATVVFDQALACSHQQRV